ncbi:Hemicentin-1-like 4 [Homarus americanus]|uniref:Hemicentin-1-like 4 n=1 Tax=Homarus americanus TaxID=6706 RepID=A0A8J5N0S0_HOMAM|nr:Hemicentin-1-like 4 [Homarus americanus]
MKSIGNLVFLGLVGLCLGQGFGGMQAGGEVLWTEDYTIDNMGSSPIIIASDTGQVNFPFYRELPTSTPAPLGGVGGTDGTETDAKGESWSPHVTYKGKPFVAEREAFSVLCNLTLFDQLKWTHNGKPVVAGEGGYSMTEEPGPEGFITSRLSVANAHMYHAGQYKCTSFIPRSHTVFVLSANSSGTESVQVLFVGYPMRLSCNLTNQDDEKLESGDHIKIFQENSSLLINSPVREDVGIYKCETDSGIPLDKPFFKTIQVIHFEIRRMDKSMNVDMEKDIVLICPVEGKPYPNITWKKDDRPVTELINQTRITYEPNEHDVPNSKIIIASAGWADRGNYTCVIDSLSKTFERFTFIRVKEVLLLGIIIFIFEKRRVKAEFEESDTDQGNDQKNTAEHNKDLVRQRKKTKIHCDTRSEVTVEPLSRAITALVADNDKLREECVRFCLNILSSPCSSYVADTAYACI